MCSRAFTVWLSLSFVSCASDTAPTASDAVSLSAEPGRFADSPCGSPNWHILQGPSFGHGDAPAQHQAPDVELDVQSSAGFEVGRSSLVYSALGNQLFVEIKNREDRWRCGIRSFPSLAYDAEGVRTDPPFLDDIGYTILAATGMTLDKREGLRGSCLGPGETGYLQIRMTKALAKVTLQLEATHDAVALGPPPTCVVPDTYTYAAGSISIQAHRAGTSDPMYTPALGGGVAVLLAMDGEKMPVAMFTLAPDAHDATDAEKATFTGLVSLSGGTSEHLAVLVW